MRAIFRWVQGRDAGFSALRRAGRAAIVMPLMFGVAVGGIGDAVLAMFAAFGSMALLLFVDFGGAMRERLLAQGMLVVTGAVLITLGTLAAQYVWLATVGMLVVGFVVLFVGVVSSVLAGATTALLISFILPVSLPGPLSTLPDRLGGWVLAGAVTMIAISVLWPAPAVDPLRAPIAKACSLMARRLRAHLDGEDSAELAQESVKAVEDLRRGFFTTPYRPTGLTTQARMLVRLVDQIVWLDSIMEDMPVRRPNPVAREVKVAGAELLEGAAALLETGTGDLTAEFTKLRNARAAMEKKVTATLPVHYGPTEFVQDLYPSFRAQEMTFAITEIAETIELSVAARKRTWWQQLIGLQPPGAGSTIRSFRERIGAHLQRNSVWLHNSIRGAIALSVAVLVSYVSGVGHSFWVVLGSMAVLRSNALSTGQNTLRALVGTTVGIVLGGLLVSAIGTNVTISWILLPFAIILAGLAPAVISFAAGQAAFTITLLVLFTIIEPTGWQTGLVRIEDVAIGGAVSLAVGILFWPRGAAPAMRRAVADALTDSAHYLRSAVDYGVSRCDECVPATPPPTGEAQRAAASARRMDDAFRSYLAERGSKHVTLAGVSALVTAVAVIRLTAEAILDLWEQDSSSGDRTAARRNVLATGKQLVDWYDETAAALANGGKVPQPLAKTDDIQLIDAVRHDLDGNDPHATATAVKVIWTADHLDAVRRLQAGLG
ncbi:FUSC family protein [Actinocrispum sp. NPDC049592]|uniref:FUSC family protein n=1 Tax=Actinocrispum sp. NPDC049592 TaxID=3154835 RepID=UPI003420EA51